MINSFVERLAKLGIDVSLQGNYPWIYLYKINDTGVTEKFMANHGWTVFILKQDGTYYMPDRKAAFKLIRKYIKED